MPNNKHTPNLPKARNLVAKHASAANKASVHKDRKREVKRGYQKHATQRFEP